MHYLKLLLIGFSLFIAGCTMSPQNNISANLHDISSVISDHLTNDNVIQLNDWSNDRLLSQRKIVVTTRIDPITSRRVIEQLLYLDGIDSSNDIDLYIRTTGGWLNDAFAVVDVMGIVKAKINVHCVGTCQSAGVVILQASTGKRFIGKNSELVLHVNYKTGDGVKNNAEENLRNRFLKLIRFKADIPAEWLVPDKDDYYYLNSDMAKKYNLVDSIE